MPAESLKSEASDPIPTSATWPTLMKNPPNEGDECMMMMKAKKMNVIETNSTNKAAVMESKKSCICSPTSHVGSFRCHLHRAPAGSTTCCTGSTSLKKGGQTQEEPNLSRFGRTSTLKLKPRLAG